MTTLLYKYFKMVGKTRERAVTELNSFWCQFHQSALLRVQLNDLLRSLFLQTLVR